MGFSRGGVPAWRSAASVALCLCLLPVVLPLVLLWLPLLCFAVAVAVVRFRRRRRRMMMVGRRCSIGGCDRRPLREDSRLLHERSALLHKYLEDQMELIVDADAEAAGDAMAAARASEQKSMASVRREPEVPT